MNMLQELLEIVSKEELATPTMLARRLNISQAMVELMLADLERAGYLRAVTGDCGGCTGCGSRQVCRPSQVRLWISTGRKN